MAVIEEHAIGEILTRIAIRLAAIRKNGYLLHEADSLVVK
jgi:hypothetical protein